VLVSVLRYVARIRLVKTVNPSACATVNCKLCKSAIGLHLSVIKTTCNPGANKSNHPNWNPLFLSRVPRYSMLQSNAVLLVSSWGRGCYRIVCRCAVCGGGRGIFFLSSALWLLLILSSVVLIMCYCVLYRCLL
jgi:hypothetical protein